MKNKKNECTGYVPMDYRKFKSYKLFKKAVAAMIKEVGSKPTSSHVDEITQELFTKWAPWEEGI